MAWTTPLTAVANATLTAAQWNASVRDNLNMTAPALASAAGQIFSSSAANTIAARSPAHDTVATSEGTTSTSYTNLATFGPSVTLTCGTKAIVAVSAWMSNSSSTGYAFMSFATSGANSIAADDGSAASNYGTAAYTVAWVGMVDTTAGSTTFAAKYRVAVGGTGTFIDRQIMVIPI